MFHRVNTKPREAPLVGGSGLDERWNDAAARLLESLSAGRTPLLDPDLEHFLRRFVRQKAGRWVRQLEARAGGVDVEDVVQRVFLQLLEHPPQPEAHGRPMRRLLSWVNAVSHNYLCDLTARQAERLAVHSRTADSEAPSENYERAEEERYAARRTLAELRPLLEREYPAGLPLLDLLLESPHASSQELAGLLGTSVANVDQQRSRLRRVLRKRLGNPGSPGGTS